MKGKDRVKWHSIISGSAFLLLSMFFKYVRGREKPSSRPSTPHAPEETLLTSNPHSSSSTLIKDKSRSSKKLMGFFVTGIGLVSAIFTVYIFLRPLITVAPLASKSLYEGNMTLILSNNSYLPIYNVVFNCEFIDSHTNKQGCGEYAIEPGEWKQIESGGNAAVNTYCYNQLISFGGTFDKINLLVTYRPFLMPYRKEQLFTFYVEHSQGKEIYLLPVP